MRRISCIRIILLLALFVTTAIGCKSTYQKETPYGQSKWSSAISSIGKRIREEKPVTMQMMREKFGPENLTRPLTDDRTQARWYLRTANDDQTSLVIAEYENSKQRVTSAELKEMPPKVSRNKRRGQADFYLKQIQSGKAMPVSDVRVALGIEKDGRFLPDGRLELKWSVYPGLLVGLTDTTGARIVRAVIDE